VRNALLFFGGPCVPLSRRSDKGVSQRLKFAVSNTPANAMWARRQILSFVATIGVDQPSLTDLEIAVGEALANACEHGHRPRSMIRIEVRQTDAEIEFSIADGGPGFTPAPHPLGRPDALSPRGFGLYLLQSVTDKVAFLNGGKTVWFSKRCEIMTGMSQEGSQASAKKVQAIYSLREAAEAKAVAEVKAEAEPSSAARDTLLDAQLHLEAKTQDAIEACHECGYTHSPDDPHHKSNILQFPKDREPER
jgi:anti-sigma regulatory factor (Ser/Thr protein kinase)